MTAIIHELLLRLGIIGDAIEQTRQLKAGRQRAAHARRGAAVERRARAQVLRVVQNVHVVADHEQRYPMPTVDVLAAMSESTDESDSCVANAQPAWRIDAALTLCRVARIVAHVPLQLDHHCCRTVAQRRLDAHERCLVVVQLARKQNGLDACCHRRHRRDAQLQMLDCRRPVAVLHCRLLEAQKAFDRVVLLAIAHAGRQRADRHCKPCCRTAAQNLRTQFHQTIDHALVRRTAALHDRTAQRRELFERLRAQLFATDARRRLLLLLHLQRSEKRPSTPDELEQQLQ